MPPIHKVNKPHRSDRMKMFEVTVGIHHGFDYTEDLDEGTGRFPERTFSTGEVIFSHTDMCAIHGAKFRFVGEGNPLQVKAENEAREQVRTERMAEQQTSLENILEEPVDIQHPPVPVEAPRAEAVEDKPDHVQPAPSTSKPSPGGISVKAKIERDARLAKCSEAELRDIATQEEIDVSKCRTKSELLRTIKEGLDS